MARIRFSRDWDWKPSPRVTIAYRGGHEYTVKRECADAAVKDGAGKEIRPPAKGKGDGAEA